MASTCANHPDKTGYQICDSCSRYLCRDCIDEIKWFPGRDFHFCYQEPCNRLFLKKARSWLIVVGVFLAYMLIIIILMLKNRDFSKLWLLGLLIAINIGSFRITIRILRDYRRRSIGEISEDHSS